MWKLNYTLEANNYAFDSHPYNEDVLIAIERLALTATGLPPENCREWKPDYYLWSVASHYVTFHRILEPQPTITILMIKPMR